jgi:hypothetical protein
MGFDARQNDESWKQEEYKALRAEILSNVDYQKNLIIFGTSVLAAALGFIFRDQALIEHRSLLLLLTQILALGFWHAYERRSLATEEIGTYISCHLEKHTALNWEIFQRAMVGETRPARLGEKSNSGRAAQPKKSFRRRVSDAFSQAPFVIFSVVCVVLIAKEVSSLPSRKNMAIAVISGLLIAVMVWAIYLYEAKYKDSDHLIKEAEDRLEAARVYRNQEKLHLPAPVVTVRAGAGADGETRQDRSHEVMVD